MTSFNYRNIKNNVKLTIKAENENKATEVLKNLLTESGISEFKKEQFILE